MYRSLNAESIVSTAERLCSRIEERFPDSGLGRVSRELLRVARESVARAEWLRRPCWIVRAAVCVTIAAILASGIFAAVSIRVSIQIREIADLLQAVDAGVNEMILLALALIFLVSVETRMKRNKALRALHQLRSIAHVIDMHQLTKDPEAIATLVQPTASSPQRKLTPFQLSRYLDYCSELLSLTSKLAALHVQHLRDPVVLGAVNDVEALTDGLSQKIWQKIAVLEMKLQGDLAARSLHERKGGT